MKGDLWFSGGMLTLILVGCGFNPSLLDTWYLGDQVTLQLLLSFFLFEKLKNVKIDHVLNNYIWLKEEEVVTW